MMKVLCWVERNTSRHVREHMLALLLITMLLFNSGCMAGNIPYGDVRAVAGPEIVYGLKAATMGEAGTFVYFKDVANGGRAYMLGWPKGVNYEWIAVQGNSFRSALQAAVPMGANKAAPETLCNLLKMIEDPSSGWQRLLPGAIPATMVEVVNAALLSATSSGTYLMPPLLAVPIVMPGNLELFKMDPNVY